ncbi:MAG: RNA polymerase subunit sigma, partial [Planctomycetes bacterium]|nr:RNA polymerase subunit sigma [Planctomycetota bacterium]
MEEHAQTTGIEELLESADWLQGLAEQLVQDPHLADDLVQDTWLAALRQPPTTAGPNRAWLATVLRRLSSRRAR